MGTLVEHVSNIEAKYGDRWFEKDLDLSNDPDWISILKIRASFSTEFQPLCDHGYNYSGNPKKWTDECRSFVQEELYNLFESGVIKRPDINIYFGLSRTNKSWFLNVIKYFEMEDYYNSCVEDSKKVMVVDNGRLILFNSVKAVAEHYDVSPPAVSYCLNTNSLLKKKYAVHRYVP